MNEHYGYEEYRKFLKQVARDYPEIFQDTPKEKSDKTKQIIDQMNSLEYKVDHEPNYSSVEQMISSIKNMK